MQMTQDELLALVTHGGGTLIFIALASVIALALFIERFIAMHRVIPSAKLLHEAVTKSLLKCDVKEAHRTALRSQALIADVYLAGFSRWQHNGGKYFEDAVFRQRLATVLQLKKRLWAIGTVGTIAPFIGLFGTVVGIMSAFSSMAETGTGGFTVVAGGISQALIATAGGIAVAIQAVIFFNFLKAKLGTIAAELKLMSEEFCELLSDTAATMEASKFKFVGVCPPPEPSETSQQSPSSLAPPNTVQTTNITPLKTSKSTENDENIQNADSPLEENS